MNDKRQHVAAALIIYYPEPVLVSNMMSYYDFVDKIYVYDNSEKPVSFINWTAHPKVEYFHDGVNRGLPERLNSAAQKAIAEGYSWLLTMDQDSHFSKEDITLYFECFRSFEQPEDVALFGPVHSDEIALLHSAPVWKETKSLITSGALTNLDCYVKMGGFDEALFIDAVDSDYCIRANLDGFRLIQFTDVLMKHAVGETLKRSSIKTLFLVKKSKSLHSPIRYYYMLRNFLYMQQKYRGKGVAQMKEIGIVVKARIMNYLFYGRNSKALLQHLLLAYRHFKQNKMGKLGQ